MSRIEEEQLIRILEVIQHMPMTTDEIQRHLGVEKYACPEDLIRILTKMKRQGIIMGGPNPSIGCWVWWQKECRAGNERKK